MNNYSKTLLAVALVGLLAAVAPLSTAQTTGTGFGTQVKLGDVDFRPTTQAAGLVIDADDTATQFVRMIDFGVTNDVNDNCVFLDLGAAGTVTNFDIRLTPCQGKAAGTLVGDSDTVEKASTFATVAATSDSAMRYADVNNNGRYDSGDCVYFVLRTNAAAAGANVPAVIAASTGNNDFTLRLTPCSGKAAGTLVFASDADFTSYGAATTVLEGANIGLSFFDADNTGGITAGDSVYLNAAAISAAGALFPQFSVRLVGGSGAFGTQMKLGDSDFVPVRAAAPAQIALATGTILQIDFGVTNQVTDNCFYYHPAGAGTSVVNFDIRLTPCQGKAAGTFVADADTVEKATAGAASTVTAATGIRYADVNNNGRYDLGDYVYMISGAGTALVASTSPTAFTVRLTPAGSFAAGTLVFASDSDFTSYNGATTAIAAQGVAVFDADNTASLTAGDSAYLVPSAVAAGAVFPQYSVRLAGGSGAFGTQLKLGDADFVPTLISTAAGTLVATGRGEIDFGVTTQVTDNCFYYGGAAIGANVVNFNVRLTSCQGKTAGSMVADADTVEKATTTVAAPAFTTVTYADVNNNGRYDLGDYVYVGTGAANALTASTSNTAWTLRLTPAGSNAAGTLVFASDADFTSYRAASPVLGAGTGVVAYFDADNTATITAGDVVYVLPGALAGNGLVSQFSVRLSGTPTASGPTSVGQTPTSSSTATSTSTSTGSSTATGTGSTGTGSTGTGSTGTGSTGSETDDDNGNETPGFELVALVAALGAALVLVRRKL